MEFWEADKREYAKTILVVPNYTYFGDDKDVNKDSFVLVMKSFLENAEGYDDVRFIIPHINNHIPHTLAQFDNVVLKPMGNVSSFPPLMRTQFPSAFFRKIFTEEKIDLIWSHLPEWSNRALITRRYNPTQPIIGYCHWWELKDNGGYTYNSFVDNINGILQMEVCGVNSQWVKDLVVKRAGEIFNSEVCDKLETILQPWYLGVDGFNPSQIKNGVPTFLFNHRINEYTGGDWFFDTMDKFWDKGYDFRVYVTSADIKKPYVKFVGSPDRTIYLENIGHATIGIGAFNKYSAWSMSVTDGLSVGVPYLLPKGLCYEEMVGDNYPLYNNRSQLKEHIEMILQDRLSYSHIDLQPIVDKLKWKNVLHNWNVKDYLDK